MNQEHKTTCCGDCIFRIDDFDPDSPVDTVSSCGYLHRDGTVNWNDKFIAAFDSERDTPPEEFRHVLPKCPLKNGPVTISLEKH